MNKTELRALTLGANKKFQRKQVTVEGQTFEIRQPSLKERGDFRKNAMTLKAVDGKDNTVDFDIFEFQMSAVLVLTLVPGTDERVFEDTDREALEACPAGGWFDELAKVANELCNVSDSTIKND